MKAPFSCPNSSLSSSVSGSAPQLTAMNGLPRRGESRESPRDQLLARAALALDEHRARDRRHLLDLDEHFPHRLALADEARALLQPRGDREGAAPWPRLRRATPAWSSPRHAAGARSRSRPLRIGRTRASASVDDLVLARVATSWSARGSRSAPVRTMTIGCSRADRAANVVERRHERRLDAGLLERALSRTAGSTSSSVMSDLRGLTRRAPCRYRRAASVARRDPRSASSAPSPSRTPPGAGQVDDQRRRAHAGHPRQSAARGKRG